MDDEIDYDFAGWVTKNDILCDDGRTIRHGAFDANDGMSVPLVWEHNSGSITNVLGHMTLSVEDGGVYGYGYFNSTGPAAHAKEALKHGDINAMSIAANKLKHNANRDVLSGSIYEVSLVSRGANRGALIDYVNLAHSVSGEPEETAIIMNGLPVFPMEGIFEHSQGGAKGMNEQDALFAEMVGLLDEDEMADVVDLIQERAMATGIQHSALSVDPEVALGQMIDLLDDEDMEDVIDRVQQHILGEVDLNHSALFDDDEEDDDIEGLPMEDMYSGALGLSLTTYYGGEEPQIKHTANRGTNNMARHNVFERSNGSMGDVLQHSDLNDILKTANKKKTSWKTEYAEFMLQHSGVDLSDDEDLRHSITDIDYLFPDAKQENMTPYMITKQNTATELILAGVRKSPFSKVKTRMADLTTDGARAKGYITGAQKVDQVFGLLTREVSPATVYVKQKIDRDDVIDIIDFDVVRFMNAEMRVLLNDEVARAIITGDGRLITDPDKISETNVIPIISDADLYTIKYTATIATIIDKVLKSRKDYQGSGNKTMLIDPAVLAELKLIRKTDGGFLFGDLPSTASMAERLGVRNIVECVWLTNAFLIVDLNDYTVGSTRGGEITSFEDFDIDYNQHKYLIETRMSGALTKPKSAQYYTVTDMPA